MPTPPRAGRILVVSPQPFYEDRGTPIAVRQLVTALVEAGFAVDVATFPVGADIALPGVRIHRCANPFRIRRVPIGFSVRKLLLDATLFLTVHRLLRTRRYYSVHGVEEGGFIAALCARGTPLVWEMQSSLPEQLSRHRLFGLGPVQRLLRACERWLVRRSDVVACSAGLGEVVRALDAQASVREWAYPAPPVVAHTMQHDALRSELHIPGDARVVVYSGSFERYQGLEELVAAIPRVSREVPGTVFVLVGADAAGESRIRRHAAAHGLNGNLRVVPRQPLDRVVHYHAMADVLLAPRAFGRNIPLKLFHYLAAGRAIVATGLPGDAAPFGSDLMVIARHSSEAIAGAVIDLLRDPVRAAALAGRARLWAEARLAPAAYASAVREVCASIRPAGAT